MLKTYASKLGPAPTPDLVVTRKYHFLRIRSEEPGVAKVRLEPLRSDLSGLFLFLLLLALGTTHPTLISG
jgi:hypothetical protein